MWQTLLFEKCLSGINQYIYNLENDYRCLWEMPASFTLGDVSSYSKIMGFFKFNMIYFVRE